MPIFLKPADLYENELDLDILISTLYGVRWFKEWFKLLPFVGSLADAEHKNYRLNCILGVFHVPYGVRLKR